MSRLAPILETPRLRLRGYALDDFEWFNQAWQDEEVNRFTGGRIRSRVENWPRFLLNFGQWELFGYGFWLIEAKADGERLGICGLMHALRDIDEIEHHPETGWVLARPAFGKGYASEAMRAVLEWADAHVDAPQTGCIIEEANTASIRVARKLGYACTGPVTFEDGEILVFARPRGAEMDVPALD